MEIPNTWPSSAPCPSWKVVTSSVSELSTCQLKLPGVRMSWLLHVVDASMTTSVVARMDHEHQRRVRHRRPDQPRACLVDRQPQIGHRVEVEILERADGGDDGAHHGKVLQLCRNPDLDRTITALVPVVVVLRRPSDLPAMSTRHYSKWYPS